MKAAAILRRLPAALCALLAGCQTAPQNASLQCGAGAAATGYLVCKLLGRPDSECVKAAAVVGVGGAAVCYSYASNLDKRRKELAGRENDLDARIRYVRGINADSEQLNADLGKRVAATTQSTDELLVQVRQQKVTAARLEKERQAREEELRGANAQLARGEDALTEVKAYRTRARPASPDLDAAIQKQEQLLADARRQVDLLAAQRARV
jgi:hypothetical protein